MGAELSDEQFAVGGDSLVYPFANISCRSQRIIAASQAPDLHYFVNKSVVPALNLCGGGEDEVGTAAPVAWGWNEINTHSKGERFWNIYGGSLVTVQLVATLVSNTYVWRGHDWNGAPFLSDVKFSGILPAPAVDVEIVNVTAGRLMIHFEVNRTRLDARNASWIVDDAYYGWSKLTVRNFTSGVTNPNPTWGPPVVTEIHGLRYRFFEFTGSRHFHGVRLYNAQPYKCGRYTIHDNVISNGKITWARLLYIDNLRLDGSELLIENNTMRS